MAIATLLLNSCLLALTLGYSVNTPRRHPQLCLGKTLPYNLMGTGQCLESRNLLAGNRLHLGAWHGFQEVFFASPMRVQAIRLRCQLEDGAYLNVILNRQHKGFSAIRVSRDKNRPNLYFQALPSGQIVRKWPLPLPAPQSGWNRLQVERSGPRWVVTLGDQQCTVEAGEELPGLVGLRGGRKDAIVDDFEVRSEDGQVLRETFDSSASFVRHFVCSLALLLILDLIWRLSRQRGGFRALALLRLSVFSALVTYTLIDYRFWSHRYCAGGMTPFGEAVQMDPLEVLRTAALSTIDFSDAQPSVSAHEQLRNSLRIPPNPKFSRTLNVFEGARLTPLQDTAAAIDSYLSQHPETPETILFLGTSQTHGSGAVLYTDGMVAVLARGLQQTYSSRPFRVVNAAVCGSQSSELLARTRNHLMKFRPQLLVLNLGTNDDDPQVLRRNLESWGELAESHGCRIACVLEANSLEKYYALATNHQILRDVASVRGWQVLDLYQHLGAAEREDRGLLWWDFVHPTDFGHELAGQFLLRELRL